MSLDIIWVIGYLLFLGNNDCQYNTHHDSPAAQAAKNFSLDRAWGIIRWVLLCW